MDGQTDGLIDEPPAHAQVRNNKWDCSMPFKIVTELLFATSHTVVCGSQGKVLEPLTDHLKS